MCSSRAHNRMRGAQHSVLLTVLWSTEPRKCSTHFTQICCHPPTSCLSKNGNSPHKDTVFTSQQETRFFCDSDKGNSGPHICTAGRAGALRKGHCSAQDPTPQSNGNLALPPWEVPVYKQGEDLWFSLKMDMREKRGSVPQIKYPFPTFPLISWDLFDWYTYILYE